MAQALGLLLISLACGSNGRRAVSVNLLPITGAAGIPILGGLLLRQRYRWLRGVRRFLREGWRADQKGSGEQRCRGGQKSHDGLRRVVSSFAVNLS